MSNAIFWIASTEKYVQEAIQSAESVARHMPDVKRILFTATVPGSDIYNETYALLNREHNYWYLDFVRYMKSALILLSGYNKLIYLDTDTYICAPVYEIFDLLDRFDIASTHAPARQISPTFKLVPDCFAEFNTGVTAFRNNYKVKQLFKQWFEVYHNNPDLYGENDQAPLREALYYDEDIKQYVLPMEYNCRFGFGGQAAGMIKILHGRSDNMPALAQKINDDQGIRGWRRGDFE